MQLNMAIPTKLLISTKQKGLLLLKFNNLILVFFSNLFDIQDEIQYTVDIIVGGYYATVVGLRFARECLFKNFFIQP